MNIEPRPLPMTMHENSGKQFDVILITGDAYVDHPAWGVAVIGRMLQGEGYSVGIIAQPDWKDVEAFRQLGRPRLFFGVTAGNMDSMVNHMTSARHRRDKDAYSAGGETGLRPDRATIPYTAMAKAAFSGVPVVIGGIEASLRRMVHYDFWSDKLRGSLLLDSKADLLVYGMAERTIVEIAKKLDSGSGILGCRDLVGTSWAATPKEVPLEDAQTILVPSLEEIRIDRTAFNKATVIMYRESNPHCAKRLIQPHGARAVVINPPAMPLTSKEFDGLYALGWTRAAHPCYREEIPALKPMVGSLTVNRGCSGGCSFCALTIHQGKDVTSRTEESVMAELKEMAETKGFNGIVSDLGGPTANMYHMRCLSEKANALCRRVSCLHPKRCTHYGTDHKPYLSLLRKARNLPGIKKVFVNSGIRYDLATEDDSFIEELATHHVQGQLSVAPEHASDKTLALMRKPAIKHFDKFVERFEAANKKNGKEQYLVPYFICGHPGNGPEETIELAIYMQKKKLRPRQVQLFMPTPATLATAMYYTGKDPHTKKPVYVARGAKERSRQRALLFYWKREEWPHVREALNSWGRQDLIGKGAEYLVPPGTAYGAWQKGGTAKPRAIPPTTTPQKGLDFSVD
jgi:uncharacterized radical SAM protein YgiQ